MSDLTSVPSQVDFTMVSGDSKTIRVKCVGTDRQPFALNELQFIDYGISKNVRSAKLVSKTQAAGASAVQDGDDWYIDVVLLPADTADLKGEYFHECQVRLTDGTVLTPYQGTVTIIEDLN